MKALRFEYGIKGLEIKVDPSWNTTIIKPVNQPPIANPNETLRKAIQNPLGIFSLEEIIKSKAKLESICIVASDATRPVPSHLIIDALIMELEHLGLGCDLITILIATGLHRPSNEKEIERIVGNKYCKKVKIINHNAKDQNSLEFVGDNKDGSPISINKAFLDSDLKIITGYVEPHFFFGFSGGIKAIVPGIAGKETIMFNHSAENIASPYSRFGIYDNNPMVNISADIVNSIGVDFTVNVCINEKHQITKVAAG
ncbi:MAG: lactate racemase domain-containing protein, partial [Candidatus Thorarchaeota archaeon]